MVCEKDYEPRHPQDFIRAIPDMQRVPFVRPEASDTFVSTSTVSFSTDSLNASIVSPSNSDVLTGTVSILINTQTDPLPIVSIKFYVDDVLTYTYTPSTTNETPIRSFTGLLTTWDSTTVSDGSHTFYIITTTTNAVTVQSATITATTSNLTVLTIDAPITGFTNSATLGVSFTVAGGPGVNYVRIYFNSILIGTYDNTALGTTDFSDGVSGINVSSYNDCTNHTLQLVVEDINANTSVTASITGKVCY